MLLCAGQAVAPTVLTKHCDQASHSPEISLIEGKSGEGAGEAEQKQAGSASLQALIAIGLLLCLTLPFFSLTNLLGMALICPNPEGLVIVNIFTCR